MPFVIPRSCPITENIIQTDSLVDQVTQEQEVTSPLNIASRTSIIASPTSAMHNHKKRKDKVPLVETEVRRSCRLQKLNKGFKKNICVDKNCLACHALPPPIPAKVVKNLNTTFCKVSARDTSEEILASKPKKIKNTHAGKESSKGNSSSKDGDKGAKEHSK